MLGCWLGGSGGDGPVVRSRWAGVWGCLMLWLLFSSLRYAVLFFAGTSFGYGEFSLGFCLLLIAAIGGLVGDFVRSRLRGMRGF